MKRCAAWLGCVAALAAGSAWAHEGDTFRPFLSAGYFSDSNLFRLDENESPSTPRPDRYALYQGGLNMDWKPGRQQVLLSATKTLIRYDRNTYLDFNGDDLQGTWNWRLGNRVSGKLGATRSTSQSSFGDIGRVNNSVDRERRFGRVEWELHPRWRIGGGIETTDNTNSDTSQASQNFTQDSYDLVLTYLTPKGSNLRAQVRHTKADYPNMQVLSYTCILSITPCPTFLLTPALVADTSFDQNDFLLGSDWRVSGKLTLRGQAGWSARTYANQFKNTAGTPALVERPDFSGFTARVTGDWFPTGKTLVSTTLYQELGGATDINASSVLKRGVKLDGVWLVREKWRLNAGATFENRDYRGDPGTVPGLTRRNDDTLGGSLGVSYTPIEAVSVDLGVQAGRRDSNINNENYSFHTVYLSVRGDF